MPNQLIDSVKAKYGAVAESYAAASVKVYALKPGSNAKQPAPCCAPGCCS